MSFIGLAGFAAAMFVLAITPGPGVFATVSKALSSGFRSTLPVIAGIVVGDLVFLLLAVYGLSAVAESCNSLFVVIRYLGGCYLIWLGIKLWRSTPRAEDVGEGTHRTGRYSFLSGLSITLSNPKVILFYVSFLPTFIDMTALAPVDVAAVGGVLSAVLGGVMAFYAFTASRVRRVCKSTIARRRMDRVAGTVMAGAGAALLATSRT